MNRRRQLPPDAPWPRRAGLLDVFEVRINGVEGSITLSLNLYDPGAPLAPQGFAPRPR